MNAIITTNKLTPGFEDPYTSTLGMYVDLPRPYIHENDTEDDQYGHWADMWCKDRKLDHLVLVTNIGSTDAKWIPDIPNDRIIGATLALQKRGKTVRWMTCPFRDRQRIRQHNRILNDLYVEAFEAGVDVSSVLPEIDLEWWWDHASKKEADLLMSGILAIEYVDNIVVNFVPQFKGKPNPYVEAVLKYKEVKIALLQAYSFYQHKANHWSQNAAYRVGGKFWSSCVRCADYIRAECGIDLVLMGQSLYMQNHPEGPVGTAALRAWRDKAYEDNFIHIVCWSGKHSTPEKTISGFGKEHDADWAMCVIDYLVETATNKVTKIPDTGEWDDRKADLRGLQTFLKGKGLYNGAIDNKFGPKSRKALFDYSSSHPALVASEEVTKEALQAIINELTFTY